MSYQDKAWRQAMRVRVDFCNMMSETIGKRGISQAELDLISPKLTSAVDAMKKKRPQMKWRELPFNQEEVVADILEYASGLECENFVVLGIGGSALGPISVQQALNHLQYNINENRGGPRLFVEDNVDPERMAALLDIIDLDKTVFNVITKSGSTSETMAQLLIITELLKQKLGSQSLKQRLVATTDKQKGNLIKIARELDLKTFYVPDGVGGRFSELCPVGLLPAAVCGIDIKELLAGAAYMSELCDEPDIYKNPAYMMAALQYIAYERGHNISVMMPYADSLKYISDWYAQLWAESLGKRYDNEGNEVYTGQTPVKALGVTDQHSQVQLYTEGPFDKVITFLGVDKYRKEFPIPKGFEDIPDVAFLGGHSLNELIKAEQYATEYAVMVSGHMSRTINLPEVNAFTIGQLLYLFEIETAFMGELLGINTFDQPGVEEGKAATYALLGKKGYEKKKEELNLAPKKNPRYII